MTVLPDGVFALILSVLTGGLAGTWLVHDLVFIARVVRRGPAARRDPLVGDQLFGYAIGIVIALVGIVGTLRFNGVI